MNEKNLTFLFAILAIVLILNSCKVTKASRSTHSADGIQTLKLGGGSSGMTQIDSQTYLVVYDLKNFKDGTRIGLIKFTEEALEVSAVKIDNWGEEGLSSDLESICKIPGLPDEYLVAESGNWEKKLGRIFHIKVDISKRTASVLGSTKLPFLDENKRGVVGDQYESMACLPYNENQRMLILGERGGSEKNPTGVVRWGFLDLETYKLELSDAGMAGILVDAPGNWTDRTTKRDMTDFYIDATGGIWTAASEDLGETGPFYSVIYLIGELDNSSRERPFKIYQRISQWKEISGFKIEALSGAPRNANGSHAFGTEDEIYGGVWRIIRM